MSIDHVDLDRTYTLEGHYYRHIVRVCARLYDPEPMDGDERRDLAHRLQYVIENTAIFDTNELHDAIVAANVEGYPT